MENALQLPSELPEGFRYTDENGLTAEQVRQRQEEGLGNRMTEDQGDSLRRILFRNLFTLFNILNVSLAGKSHARSRCLSFLSSIVIVLSLSGTHYHNR